MSETAQEYHSKTHYIDVFFVEKGQITSHKIEWYLEDEAKHMFKRVISKYEASDKTLLTTLRNIRHDLIASVWIEGHRKTPIR